MKTVDFSPENGSCPVLQQASLIWIERRGMMLLPDLLGRIFLTIAQANGSILLMSQSSSEGNLCFAVPTSHAAAIYDALCLELKPEVDQRYITRLSLQKHVAIVMANGLKNTTLLCETLARHAINILVTVQGIASISIVIDAQDEPTAVNALATLTYAHPKPVHSTTNHHEWTDSQQESYVA